MEHSPAGISIQRQTAIQMNGDSVYYYENRDQNNRLVSKAVDNKMID